MTSAYARKDPRSRSTARETVIKCGQYGSLLAPLGSQAGERVAYNLACRVVHTACDLIANKGVELSAKRKTGSSGHVSLY